MIRVNRALIAVLVGGLWVGTAVPQEAPKPPKPAPAQAPKLEIQVFPLKNAQASLVADTLNQLFEGRRDVRFATNGSANSLLVQGPAAELETIRAVVAKLDVARPGDPGKVYVYPLKNIDPDKAFEDVLKVALSGREFALDKQRKAVIVSADKEGADEIEAVLRRLEDQAKRPPPPDVQVRVVWLMNIPAPAKGDPPEITSPPPANLKSLLPDLAKLGIDRPRLAAQALVNVTPGTQFQTAGRAPGSCPFLVSGRYTDKSEASTLQLQVRASQSSGGASIDLGNISTTITAPIGHMVVLGVTPTDTTTSVFVVQVLRPVSTDH